MKLGELRAHGSTEDSGPDMGLELGLGGGRSLFMGELSDATLAEYPEVADMGGWPIAIYSDEAGYSIVGAVADRYEASTLIEAISAAIQAAKGGAG